MDTLKNIKRALVTCLCFVLVIATFVLSAFMPQDNISVSNSSMMNSEEISIETEKVSFVPLEKTTTTKNFTASSSIKKYNLKQNINDNVFMDSLAYTGYNLKKHRSDKLMWKYVLASQKRGKKWLSKIGYGGGSSGYETKNGKPNIKKFQKGGLVCASYVTYVYFNYLPNVAKINTSKLDKPKRSYDANEWYKAAQKWVKKGYSEYIGFTAKKNSVGHITFKAKKTIPIGSIICFTDARHKSNHCSHVCIYAGYKNGYNWVYQVGNSNGPEFCAIERFNCGADPQWPIKVISTPNTIRFTSSLNITVKDNKGNTVKGVKLSLKNLDTKKTVKLSNTNSKGISLKEGLDYGKYQITVTAPNGYTIKNKKISIKLTGSNNSYKNIKVTLQKKA